MRTDEFHGVLDKLLEPVPRPLRLLDWSQPRCAGWSSGSSGLIKSRTGDTPFQSLMRLAFQESWSFISSSKCFLVFTLSTINQAGGQYTNKKRNVEQSKKKGIARFSPDNSRLLLLSSSPGRRSISSAPASSWSSFSLSCRRRATSSSKPTGAISGQ